MSSWTSGATSVPGSDGHRALGMKRKGTQTRSRTSAPSWGLTRCSGLSQAHETEQAAPQLPVIPGYNKTQAQSFESRSEILKPIHFRLIQTRFTQLIATAKGNHFYRAICVHSGNVSNCPSFFFPSKCFMWKAQGLFALLFRQQILSLVNERVTVFWSLHFLTRVYAGRGAE